MFIKLSILLWLIHVKIQINITIDNLYVWSYVILV